MKEKEIKTVIKDSGFLDVYVAEIDKVKPLKIVSQGRKNYIRSCSDENLKRQRKAVWNLLEKVLSTVYKIDESDLKFYREDSGKWKVATLDIDFSLSHTEKIVAVAISNKSVGVDVEPIREIKSKSFIDRFLSQNEKDEYEKATNKDGYLIKAWTKKESVFKAKNAEYKLTDKEDDYKYTKSLELEFDGEKHYLSVTGEEIDKLKIITGTNYEKNLSF